MLGMQVWLEKPYKLCDFRPLYGEIFSNYVDGYDFWGYCDCDLIFGDIRKFLTEELLSTKDYLLGMGHFHIQSVVMISLSMFGKLHVAYGEIFNGKKSFKVLKMNGLMNYLMVPLVDILICILICFGVGSVRIGDVMMVLLLYMCHLEMYIIVTICIQKIRLIKII